MDIVNFSNLESQVLSAFNEGHTGFKSLEKHTQLNAKTLQTVLDTLEAKNILRLAKEDESQIIKYEYQTEVEGETVVLDGNILLPTTIIRQEDRMLICRGQWYEFPLNFDIRRIIWNVKLESKTNSTLVDLIQSSVLKVKKSKLVQLEEHKDLLKKSVPYSNVVGLVLNCIAEEVTDINIRFKICINPESDMQVTHAGFSVPSEISTKELMAELNKPATERNYQNIKINQIFNFSDFIYSQNEIPVSLRDNVLTYLKITGIKKGFEFTYYELGTNGVSKKLNVESFVDQNEAIEKLRDIFKGLPAMILSENNFTSELTE